MSAQHNAHRVLPAQKRAQSRAARRARRRRTTRRVALLSALAVAGTGVAVGGGVLALTLPTSTGGASTALASTHISASLSQAELAQRDVEEVSRSADRVPVADVSKARTLSNASGPSRTRTEDLSDADPRTLAKALMPQFGMSAADFGCIDAIWTQESGWNVHADNPSSSAYGIPQALPGSKMSSAGPDWADNPVTQIKWGLGYIKDRYGSACSAASFKRSHGFY